MRMKNERWLTGGLKKAECIITELNEMFKKVSKKSIS
jgi:hypothetical protein